MADGVVRIGSKIRDAVASGVSGERRHHGSAGAMLLAGGFVAALECGFALVTARFELAAWAVLIGLLMGVSVALAVLTDATRLLVERFAPREGWPGRVLFALTPAIFPLAVVSQARLPGVAASAILLGVACASGVVVVVLARRAGVSSLALLLGSVAPGFILWTTVHDLRLLERAGSGLTDPFLWALIASAPAVHLFSLATSTLLAPAQRRIPLLLRAALLSVGAALLLAPPSLLPDQYLSLRPSLLVAALLLFAVAFRAGRGLSRRTLLAATVASVLAVGVVAAFASRLTVHLHHSALFSLSGAGLLRALPIAGQATERRMERLLSTGADCGGYLSASPVLARPAQPQASSVLLITVDTLRYDHAGYGRTGPASVAPRLRAFAKNALRFHRAYAQGGWTSLSLPALMWSRHPKDIRFTPLAEDSRYRLYLPEEIPKGVPLRKRFQSPLREPTMGLGEILAASGVKTTAVLNDGFTGYFEPRLGFARGFDAQIYPSRKLPGGPPKDADVVKLAIEQLPTLEERGLLWVHLFGPHFPYDGGHDFPSGYQHDVRETDRAIGQLLDALDKRGLADRVAVIISADHGEILGAGTASHGVSTTDAALRIPLLVKVPGMAGQDVDTEVGLIDVAPTIVSLFGQTPPADFGGDNLLSSAPRIGPVFSETWRYRGPTEVKDLSLAAAVWKEKKLAADLLTGDIAFFELSTDPNETKPVELSTDDERLWASCLLKAYRRWRRSGG